MKKIIIVLLLCLFMSQSNYVKSAIGEKETLDLITRKVMKMRQIYELFSDGKIIGVDGDEYPLSPSQKTQIANKYNTLKQELKTMVAGL